MTTVREQERTRWQRLDKLVQRIERRGFGDLSVEEVKDFCRLYRQVTIDLSRARTGGMDPELSQYLNRLAARAHSHLYSARRVSLRPVVRFLLTGFPQTFRRHWRAVAVAAAVFLLTTLASFFAVLRDRELAYSLFDENTIEFENVRLEKQQGEYRGNFTFSVSESPFYAAFIIGNNVKVAVLAFAFGALCCLPGLLLLTYNGRMLGTLSGVLWQHGYLVGFYSLILTHGVLELSAICISGAAGLLLGWTVIAPGNVSRGEAMRRAAPEAFGLLGGAAAMLVVAGLIEAYVTPHFSATVRWSVAGVTGVLMVLYLGFAGLRTSVGAGSVSDGF
jgi:uncharacterized membrane protein SpoIIM required for sporulation